MTESLDLIVELEDEPAATSLNDEITSSEECYISRKSKGEQMVGGGAEWVVVATTAVTMLPKILDAIGKLVEKSKVRSITVGNTTIKNPTAADIRGLREPSVST